MGEPRGHRDDEYPESMAVRLRGYFREEAFEPIAEFESAVLEIEKFPRDGGQTDRVFRALYATININWHEKTKRSALSFV
jgi:hypothetical protein